MRGLRSRNSRVAGWVYPLLAIVLLVLLFTRTQGIFSTAREVIVATVSPVWQGWNNMDEGRDTLRSLLTSKKELLLENSILEDELVQLRNLEYINALLGEENQQLKERLGRENLDEGRVLATVLARPGKSPFDTLVIDLGREEGVQKGARIFGTENVPLGEVAEVFGHTAKVILYSSPGVITSVSIGEDVVQAEAVGLGNSNFEIILPREVDILEGDLITIPSINTLLFGVVRDVELSPADAFQRILFKTPLNVQQLKFVEVQTRL